MKKIHKFYRDMKEGDQYRFCDNKKCNFGERVSYFWRYVTCPRCLKNRAR